MTEQDFIVSDDESFAIQYDSKTGNIFYPNDTLVVEVGEELRHLYDIFTDIYFPDLDSYYEILSIMPVDLIEGGHTSDSFISSAQFIERTNKFAVHHENIYRYQYVEDCKYLILTVQNLILSAEYCYIQYYIQITNINFSNKRLGDLCFHSSYMSAQLLFFIETFFTKLYSILDLIVKIIYELEFPTCSFSSITKLKSAKKLWGDRKTLSINQKEGTIFENCNIIKMIESLRNEAVHNGTWEGISKVYVKFNRGKIVERYMLFPDFEEGRLSTVKNRRHFFSTDAKVNDLLIIIHDEFYKRLLSTLQYINSAESIAPCTT